MRNISQVMNAPLLPNLLLKLAWVVAPGWFVVCCLILQVFALFFIWEWLLNNHMFVEGKDKWTLEIEMLQAQSPILADTRSVQFSVLILSLC